jgi:hypothetical protein
VAIHLALQLLVMVALVVAFQLRVHQLVTLAVAVVVQTQHKAPQQTVVVRLEQQELLILAAVAEQEHQQMV